MENKKIFRVLAHDTADGQEYDCFYVTELGKDEFKAKLEEVHEGTIAIYKMTEYPIEEVINLLNLYID